ncbi:50S ribosomal protein L18 [Ferrovibrio sp. MS7]|jgi:large subunit ribosomal protein L18|uniref:50S ribosomal protein L18 n=1 Tax=Ferrovibrio TaxID=1231242 RepID=UPI001B467977|nr:50S ribosomal protein L18 [Ferrovibrio sp.]
MSKLTRLNALNARRKERNRTRIVEAAHGRPRLSVHRTSRFIYAQIIDDTKGVTLASASSLEKDLRSTLKAGGNKDAAAEVGKLIAVRAKAAGINDVIFDRGGYLYHGRVKALAEAAREGGLNF